MKKTSLLVVLPVALVLGTACKPPSRYAWGKYEASLYKLAKDPTAFQRYGDNLLVQIQEGEATQQVPPGIYAEYGYYLMVSKKTSEAVVYFQKEKTRWPESGVLMDRMVKLAQGPAPAPAPAPAAAPETAPAPAPAATPAASPAATPAAAPAPAPAATPTPAPAPAAAPQERP